MSDTDAFHCTECGWTGDVSHLRESEEGPVCPICDGEVEDVE